MTTGERIRVMVADDHPIMRNGLRDALGSEEDFEVVGQASDGVEAVKMAVRVEPDVIVMDVMMPGKDGVDACREIMEAAAGNEGADADGVLQGGRRGGVGGRGGDGLPAEGLGGRRSWPMPFREVAKGRLRIPDRSIKRVFALIRGQPGDSRPASSWKKLTSSVRGRSSGCSPVAGPTPQIAEARGNKDDERQERDLPHPGEAGGRLEAGAGGLGRASTGCWTVR